MSHRILIIYDIPNWAYHRRALALQKHAPEDFSVDISPWADVAWPHLNQYELIFLLDYVSTPTLRHEIERWCSRFPILVISWNADENRRAELWPKFTAMADWTVCVNRRRYETRDGQSHCCAISNGVDTEIFRPIVPIQDRPLRALWVGPPKKGKGYEDVVAPVGAELERMGLGFDFLGLGHHEPKLDGAAMACWYNSGTFVLCASRSEGTANPVTEGAACGCIPITTQVGNVSEWGHHGEHAWLAAPSVSSFIDGVKYAIDNLERLSGACVEAMKAWDYRHRAPYYFALFRKLIEFGPESVKPFCYADVKPEEV